MVAVWLLLLGSLMYLGYALGLGARHVVRWASAFDGDSAWATTVEWASWAFETAVIWMVLVAIGAVAFLLVP